MLPVGGEGQREDRALVPAERPEATTVTVGTRARHFEGSRRAGFARGTSLRLGECRLGRIDVRLTDIWLGQADLCDVLDRARDVSELLVKEAQDWIG